jgi:hypothetical protein
LRRLNFLSYPIQFYIQCIKMTFETEQLNHKSRREPSAVPCFQGFTMLILASVIILLSGCFSVFRGTNETVEVETVADGKPLIGATCIIKQGKKEQSVVTPGKVMLPRGKEHLHVKCLKDGYRMPNESDIEADSSNLTSASGGALVGGTVGAIGAGVAMSPLLIIPGVGWVAYAATVAGGAGAGALAGGAVSAGTDAADGASYTYKSPIIIPMIPIEANPVPVNENNNLSP